MSDRLRSWLEQEKIFDVQALLVEGLSGASLMGLEDKLRLFRGLLQDHFREEEGEEGLFAEMARVAPDTAEALARLEAEHGEIRSTMQELATALEEGSLEPPQLKALRDRLVKQLGDHQQAERALLERVLAG